VHIVRVVTIMNFASVFDSVGKRGPC